MTEPLTPKQIEAINNMPAEQRYDDFICGTIAGERVWSLYSDEGWAVISDDGEEYLPVWPHAELASLWVTGGYSDCEPKPIPLQDWLEKWLPNMVDDGLLVAVAPNTDGDSITVGAEELLANIQDALGN